MLAIDDQLIAWDIDMHTDAVEFALLVVIVRRFDHDVATRDVLEETLQTDGLFSNPGFNGVGMGDTSKRNLQFVVHRPPLADYAKRPNSRDELRGRDFLSRKGDFRLRGHATLRIRAYSA